MQDNASAADAILDLPTSAFFDMDEATETRLLEQVVASRARGIRIAAPARLDPSEASEIPLLYLRHTTGLRDWQVEFERNSKLLAVDLDTGEAKINWAFPTSKRFSESQLDPSESGPPPTGSAATSTNTELIRLDARDILKLDSRPGRWAFSVLNFDWRSNTIVTEVSGEAEISGLSRARARSLFPDSSPDQRPRFAAQPGSPPIEGLGVHLAVPTPITAGASSIPIYGSLRVALPRAAIVEDWDGDQATPVAVIRATLLVVRLDELRPERFDLAIPVFGTAAPDEGELVDAWFEFDLDLASTQSQGAIAQGRAILYAVCGAHLSEPTPLDSARP